MELPALTADGDADGAVDHYGPPDLTVRTNLPVRDRGPVGDAIVGVEVDEHPGRRLLERVPKGVRDVPCPDR